MIERFDDEPPPPHRSELRDRLVALDARVRADSARRDRRLHRDIVWLAIVLFAVFALLWRYRS